MTEHEVTLYIDENILHSKLYDSASSKVKKKAVNNAVNTLKRYLPDVYKGTEVMPVEDVAEQALWLLKMDDSIQRAEMGATMVSVDGIQIQLNDMDRSIAPAVLKSHGTTSTSSKSRVGSYSASIHDSFRMGL